jgi:choline monooxygenase
MRADPMRAFLRLRAAIGIARFASAPCHNNRSITTTTDALPPWPPGDADDADADSALVRASSLPPPYYTHPSAAALDLSRVFQPAWLYAGPSSWVEKPGDYFTIGGRGGGGGGGAVPRAVVARGPDGELRAFSNVCRHRAAPVATRPRGNRLREQESEDCAMAFVCGYHGWTYRHDGRLKLAPKMGGVERLSARRLSLAPLDVEVVGPLVFVRRRQREEDDDLDSSLDAWFGAEGARAVRAVVRGNYSRETDFSADAERERASSSSSSSPRLLHVARRVWPLQCDWKVFADNFLDGGYHVACAHPQLAEGLDLRTYSSRLHGPHVSVQSAAAAACSATEDDDDTTTARLGRRAAYAWVFPNVALNRYGRWLDVNAVVSEGPGKCRVTFDWFLEEEDAQGDATAAAAVADALSLSSSQAPPSWDEQLRLLPASVSDALRSSCAVQEEDVALCEGVQAGLEEEAAVGGVYGSPALVGESSGAIGGGRYARQEAPMFHFHRALWAAYNARDE